MGKIIGGGLPVGGVGGRKDLMQVFSSEHQQPVMHASTFSGNALTMTAGLAAMRNYTKADAERINQLGSQLREGFSQAFAQAGITAHMTGSGSLSNVQFTNQPIHDSRDSLAATISAGHIPRLLYLGMIRRGVISATRLMYCISTAMTSQEVDFAVTALPPVSFVVDHRNINGLFAELCENTLKVVSYSRLQFRSRS